MAYGPAPLSEIALEQAAQSAEVLRCLDGIPEEVALKLFEASFFRAVAAPGVLVGGEAGGEKSGAHRPSPSSVTCSECWGWESSRRASWRPSSAQTTS